MADTIGSLTAVIRATAGAFDSDLKQAGRSIDDFNPLDSNRERTRSPRAWFASIPFRRRCRLRGRARRTGPRKSVAG